MHENCFHQTRPHGRSRLSISISIDQPSENMAACASSRRRRVSCISAIFFDLDNTLIKTRNADKLACDKLASILQEQYHLRKDESTLASQTFLRNFRLCPENEDISLNEWRHFLWAQALGEKHSKIAGEVAKTWLKLRYQYLAISPDISALLQQLRLHYHLGLITNGPSRAQWEKVHMLNLQQYFDCILVSGDLPWEKPNQNIFLKACQYLRVQPENCLMVGDKLETDIAGGKQASLGGTVWIPFNEDSKILGQGLQPDFTLDSVTDLLSLLPAKSKLPSHPSCPDLEDCNSNASDGS